MEGLPYYTRTGPSHPPGTMKTLEPGITRSVTTRFAESRNLLLDVFLQHLAADDGAVDVPIRVHSYAFGSAVVDGGRFHIFDKVFDRAVFGAADADTFFPVGLVRPPRLRVGDIHRVVLGDEDPAWPRELAPGVEVAAILVEDLDAIIGAVADK